MSEKKFPLTKKAAVRGGKKKVSIARWKLCGPSKLSRRINGEEGCRVVSQLGDRSLSSEEKNTWRTSGRGSRLTGFSD